MRVTFDSHIWEEVAIPENHKKNQDHHAELLKVNTALQDGRVKGYICESVVTFEAIQKGARPEYFSNRIPKTCVDAVKARESTRVNIMIEVDHDRHPGLKSIVAQKLQRAQELGMRLLYIPVVNIQLPKQFRKNRAFYELRLFETQSYADCFWEVVTAIEERGVGVAVIATIIKELQEQFPVSTTRSQYGMQLLQYAKNEAERARISKAIGEWADGDLVASHIASGNDLLCSEDRGKSARTPSIFDDDNRRWLKAAYNVHIVGLRELAAQIP